MRKTLALVACFLFLPTARPALSQSCQLDQCQENGMCALDGTCVGTPKTGGSCDDFNPCTTDDTCMNGVCRGTPRASGAACGDPVCGGTCQTVPFVGSICVPEEEDRPCTDQFGDCTTNDRCQPFIGCLGDFITCPNSDGDPCTAEFCNPGTGQCESTGSVCNECQTCNPQSGECEAGAPSPTPSRTGGTSSTPTPTPTPTRTTGPGTATSTATPTTPTAPTPTATPPPPGECVADCDGDGTVSVAELVRAVQIALGTLPLEDCDAADGDGDGVVTVVDLIDATRAVLAGSCA